MPEIDEPTRANRLGENRALYQCIECGDTCPCYLIVSTNGQDKVRSIKPRDCPVDDDNSCEWEFVKEWHHETDA